MTSTSHDFILTPQQQNLLFAALNSNKPANTQGKGTLNMSPVSYNTSPNQTMDGLSGFQGSPDLDFDYDFGAADSSFDFSFADGDQPKMIGDLPGTTSSAKSESADNDTPDKRSHPDDDEDENNEPKRRESEDKVAKKPGRKPLTTEPSSKRKAQNRAAQRAFRERKERHLKDLETKVEELEKASEASNHENSLLRAKVEQMTAELNEYKKRVSLMANSRPALQSNRTFGSALVPNINDVNFQFEFPRFGPSAGKVASTNNKPAAIPSPPTSRRSTSNQPSPSDTSNGDVSRGNSTSYSQTAMDSQTRDELANLSASLFATPPSGDGENSNSVGSTDSHYHMGGATSTSSPSASSNSNMGPSSSCGTSPEPYTQSPTGFKPIDTLTTIGEEQPGNNAQVQDFSQFNNIDMNDFNWLPQTDFQFDPQLFGDYREPQDNLFGSTDPNDTFFNEAFDVDFTTPYNIPVNSPEAQRKKPAGGADLIAQIDAAKEADDVGSDGQLLTCNKIWEKLQSCPKVQSGDFDLESLCSDLQKKAKCNGTGAVVDEKEFKQIMKKHLGSPGADCDLLNSGHL